MRISSFEFRISIFEFRPHLLLDRRLEHQGVRHNLLAGAQARGYFLRLVLTLRGRALGPRLGAHKGRPYGGVGGEHFPRDDFQAPETAAFHRNIDPVAVVQVQDGARWHSSEDFLL